MNTEAANAAAKIIITEAYAFMANKAGVSVAEIEHYVATNEIGAKYFVSLLTNGIAAVEALTA